MTISMKQENSEVIKSFLNRTFFSAWKSENRCNDNYMNYNSLELQISSACDLKCKYCYYAKNGKILYPPKISKKSLVLKNLDMLLNWLDKNNLQPTIELFSGEIFAQELGFQVLERVVEWQNKNNIQNPISIPTNYSFIFDDNKIERIESIMNKSKARIGLSCSVDGKYCDANRPFISGKIRDDAYYDKMFAFAKKWQFGFHPMVYSENIEKWPDNFLWFQENFKKHDIPFDSIYLLEVRNVEWKKQQLKDYYKFMRFLINWVKNHTKDYVSPDMFPQFLFDKKLFNTLNIFSTVGRGLGCSLQTTCQLRLGDLTTSVCHRASNPQQNLWRFVTNDKEIIDIEEMNYALALSIASYDFKNSPYCSYCSIRELCSGQCVGSMYEANGDLFTPIPTVCALEHMRIAAILDELQELNLIHHFIAWTGPEKVKAIKAYYKYFQGRV